MKARVAAAWASMRGLDRSIAQGFSSLLALRVVEKLAGFAVTMFMFRALDKEQLGQYGFIQTAVALCAIFGIPEFQNTVSQSVARGYPGTYRAALHKALRYSLVGVVLLGGLGLWYLSAGQAALGWGLLAVAPLLPALHALSAWKGVLLGEANFRGFSVAEASNALLRAVLITAALLLFPGSLLAPVVAFFIVPALQNLRQTWLACRRIAPAAPQEPGAIGYGMQSNVYSAVGIVVANLDRLLIFTLLSPALLAVYMAAEKFADLLQGTVQDMAAVLATRFSQMGRYSHRLDDALKLAALAIAAFVLLFAWLAVPPLMVLIFGESYRESIVYAQALVATVAVGNIATLRFRFIRSKLDTTSYRNVLLTGSFGKLAASLLLIPLFGLAGAVGSVLCHRIVLAGITARTIKTRYLDAPAAPAPGHDGPR
jgi:O-antigen/teichoic acid export membrane protein